MILLFCLDLYQSKKKVAFGRTFDEEEFENEKQSKKGKRKGKKKQIKVEKMNVSGRYCNVFLFPKFSAQSIIL